MTKNIILLVLFFAISGQSGGVSVGNGGITRVAIDKNYYSDLEINRDMNNLKEESAFELEKYFFNEGQCIKYYFLKDIHFQKFNNRNHSDDKFGARFLKPILSYKVILEECSAK